MAAEVHRLFFALWPDTALRLRIAETAAHLAAAHATHGRRLPPQRYHLTLQFLGDFAALRQAPVDNAIAAAASAKLPGFDLPLERAGSFGGTRVGWLGPDGMPAGLLQLWEALGLALTECGVPARVAATFAPHVTVLRDMRHALPSTAIPVVPWSVDGFALIHSQPGRNVDYTVLHHWPLEA